MNEVTVRVPSTSANLGPGFDCLGVALQIHNDVTVRIGEGGELPPIVSEAADLFFREAEIEPFKFEWNLEGDVPQGRGLGSSVTVRLGVLAGLNELTDGTLSLANLYSMCAELEGHPDNAAPAAFGGFTVARENTVARFDVLPEVYFAIVVPEFEVPTVAARRLMPQSIAHKEAVVCATNAAQIVAAFASGDYDLLRGAFTDYLHQPYRHPMIPFLYDVIQAGEDAGAYGGYLSGSGSAICCVTTQDPNAVAEAMLKATGTDEAYALVAQVDNNGAGVVDVAAEIAH